MKRVNISIDADFHEHGKKFAKVQGKSFSGLVREALLDKMLKDEH